RDCRRSQAEQADCASSTIRINLQRTGVLVHHSETKTPPLFDAMTLLVRFFLFAAAYSLNLANAAAAEHKTILMLHSVGREFRPWNEYAKDIRAELDRQS